MTIRNAHAEKSTLGVLDGIRAAPTNTIATCGLLGTNALHLAAKLDDEAVMDDPIDGGCGGQGILEYLIPL